MKALIKRIAVSSVLLATATGIAQAKTELKMGHTGAPTHHYQTISQQFADEIAKRTNGELTISVFPADQLGNQLESVEGTMIGTHDMVLASDTVLSNWVPDMGIFNLPFLFENEDEYLAAANSAIGDQLNEQLKGQGAAVIGWWANGFRHVTNSKRAINTPNDLKGLTIRVPEGQVFVDTFRSMGAAPTVMSFGELYSALQLRTIDGQENPPAHIVTQNFNEVQKYLSRTGHIHMASPLIINLSLLERLPENQRAILLQTAKEFGQRHTEMVAAQETEQWKELANRGMEIIEVEKAPFRAAVQPVYDNAGKRMNAKLIKQTEDFLAKKRSE